MCEAVDVLSADLARPNKPEMEGPKTAAEEMQMMRKLYNQMVTEKAGIKGERLIQIGLRAILYRSLFRAV
ncbi:hypothetical protein BH10ACI3_BH10ACI3_14590 [soil metagenome]